MNSKKRAKSALESLMYIWGEPLSAGEAAEACDITAEEALECFVELQREYEQEGRGIMIRRVEDSFQFVTRPENAGFVEKLCTPVRMRRLSQAALEVLAIVAYKQPVTKSEMDAIRGIKCDRIIEGLMKKDLVCELGRSEGIGRPILYGTTDVFLRQFGFSSLDELPEIGEIEDAVSAEGADDAASAVYRQMSIEDVRDG